MRVSPIYCTCPIKFIFSDSAFGDDIELNDETLSRLNNLAKKKTYTVEFI